MWVTAWILVGSAALYQPTYPPLATREECELVKKTYLKNRDSNAAECVFVKMFVAK